MVLFAPSRPAAIAAVFAAALAASSCGSSTTTVTAPSTISRCGVTLGASDATLPAEGGSGRIIVTTARECAWSASSEAPWLSIMGVSAGQGDGAIDYRVSTNADPVVRRGGIVINDRRADIGQAAGTCVIQLRQPSAGFGQSGGAGTVDVVASSPLCTWTAVSDSSWISITSGANGKGTASVPFSIAPTTGPPRTGTISVADQRFSVTQSEGCVFTISPQQQTFGAQGGSGTVAISTAAGCPWTSMSNVPWITVTQGVEGSGGGTVRFNVDATPGPARTGTLVIAGQPFTVTQGSGCAYQVSPLTLQAPVTGGTLSVNVAAAAGCGWTAQSNSPWISVAGAVSGNGDGSLAFTVEASTGPARNGSLVVAGQTVTVNQGSGCSFSIAPQSQSVAATGGSGSVSVTAPGGCAWTASTQADWIAIAQGSTSGNGNGTVQYTVAATTGGARSGTMTIAGQTFTVNQSESCSFTLAPEAATVPAAGGNVTFNVQTGGSCGWTAATTFPWIAITSAATGTGPSTVQLTVAANTASARSGTVTVGGRTFTVNQSDGCAFTISPQQQSMAAAGGDVFVTVTGAQGCGWSTQPPQAPWITVVSGSGNGNGTAQLSIASNTDAARSGTAIIAGLTFTVDQASGCTYSIGPPSRQADATGGAGSFSVTTSGGGCPWTAVPDVPWITITQGSGVGNGKVDYTVQPNTGPARTGTITVQGQVFTVTQGGV